MLFLKTLLTALKKGMACKLCGLDTKLVKAHIIPDFMYGTMYGEKHTIVQVSLDDISNRKVMQTGHYDKTILCATCDNDIIGSYERYASKIISDKTLFTERLTPEGVKHYEMSIDYPIFKLFLLSILWRSSITTLPFFKHLSIGHYEEKVRKMLLDRQSFTSEVFPMTVVKVNPDKEGHSKVIVDPITTIGTKPFYSVFLINGFVYSFLLDDNVIDFEFDSFAVKEDNRLIIPILEGQEATDYMYNIAQRKLWK